MAAQLHEITGTAVEIVPGGFGELRVTVDGRDAYAANRFWYPRPGKIVAAVRSQL